MKALSVGEIEEILTNIHDTPTDHLGTYFPYKIKDLAQVLFDALPDVLDEGEVYKVMLDREEKEDCDSHEHLLRASAKVVCSKFSRPKGEQLDLEKVKEATIDLVDRYFPKHQCKERGAAMVLYAEMIMTICKEFSRPAIVLPEERLKPIREVLDFSREAIRDAIYCEDGLDGNAGETVIKMIDDVLKQTLGAK